MASLHGIVCQQAEKFVPLILECKFILYIIFNSRYLNIPRRIFLKWMY